MALVLALATAIAYWPVGEHDFVGYDDGRYVTQNKQVQKGFAQGSLTYAFTTGDGGNWHPLTWFSHMLDVELFGMSSAGHHASNVTYHALATLLLFLVLNSWTGAPGRCAFVAGAFALHPMHVESVAWAAERKDTLSAVMWMATMAAYGWYARRPKVTRYLALIATYALGLMSKAMLVTLPFVLLLLDYWPLQRLQPEQGKSMTRIVVKLVAEKIPMLGLAAAASWATIIMQESKRAIEHTSIEGYVERVSNALLAYAGYLGKMIWPADMAVFYPYPYHFPISKVLASLAFLVAISALAVFQLRKRPYLAVGWFWFLGTLVPVIGIVQVGAQAMADRYSYIPFIGLFIMIAWGAVELYGNRERATWLIAGGVALLSIWLIGTRIQLHHWQDSESLFRRAISVTENNYMMHHNLGVVLRNDGRIEEAIRHFQEAVRINGWMPSRRNLNALLPDRGQLSQAVTNYRLALQTNPNDSSTHNNLANALSDKGELEEALVHYREAVRLSPNNHIFQSNYALNLVRAGQLDPAITAAREAIRINPTYAQAHNALAIALAQKGRPAEAIAAYREAMTHIPEWPPAKRRLAWLYATYPDPAFRSGQEAVRLANEASQRTGNRDAEMLDTLAAAQAEVGNFEAAVATAGRALDSARAAKNPELAYAIEKRLALYRARQPYRDEIPGT